MRQITHEPGRASDRMQIMTDLQIDDRLSAGERLTDSQVRPVSEHHWNLLRQSGVRKDRTGRWYLPDSE